MKRSHLKGESIFIAGRAGSFGKNINIYALQNFSRSHFVVYSRNELKQ
jgi:FlaA1/EpsC-like NDP-sugar epimerase